MEEWRVPGLSVAVVQDEKVESLGYGQADPYSDYSRAVTADTVFDIASSSKSLTAAAIALLVVDDEHYPQVQWDTPVSKLLPEDFVMGNEEYTNGVTVEDILSHRTGLPG
jgi:CubicO group peptidase (beta-lactamase class C family)